MLRPMLNHRRLDELLCTIIMTNPEFNSLDLIPIKSLLSEKEEERFRFYVPAYQRGYRWNATHVEQLVDDLLEFIRLHTENDTAFYCLQPLVVKSCEIENERGLLEVIDGQQRLTTIIILLQVLAQLQYEKDHAGEEGAEPFEDLRPDRFDIKYETRPSSSDWLKKLPSVIRSSENYDRFESQSCDYSHFAEVYRTAYDKLKNVEWQNFQNVLTDRTYFIWYYPQDTDGTNADIFDRLNAGKITLNNAELIKALMLQRSNTADDSDGAALRSIALEWDHMERRLNDAEFWGFIYSSRHPFAYDTHIEYLFDLLAEKREENRDDLTFTFSRYLGSYRTMMKESGGDKHMRIHWVGTEWKKINELFDTLNEWFSDRPLYHRIGFILEYCRDEYGHNYTPLTLSSELCPLNRDKRIERLDGIINRNVCNIKSESLFYKHKELSEILFLYNILLEDRRFNKTARFSFADYKNVRKESGWDQEHIASRIDYTVKERDRIMLGKDLIQLISGKTVEEKKDDKKAVHYFLPNQNEVLDDLMPQERELCESWLGILNSAAGEQDDERLNSVYDKTLAHYQGNEPVFGKIRTGGSLKDAKDFIWNFVLLNSRTNRSYGNHIYPVKRKRILADEFAVYTPVGTRNVFEKAYSKRITQMTSWTPDDAKAYWADIKAVVSKYVTLEDLN